MTLRNIILAELRNNNGKESYKDIIKNLSLTASVSKLKGEIKKLVNQGALQFENGVLFLLNAVKLSEVVTGVISGSARGYAYCKLTNDSNQKYFIPKDKLMGALHGDTVNISLMTGDQAEVVEILTRANDLVVGNLEEKDGIKQVVVDNKRFSKPVYIPVESLRGAKIGHKVYVKLVMQPESDELPVGEVLEDLGEKDLTKTKERAILRQFGFADQFPKSVIDESEKLHAPTEDEISKRKDLRDKRVFTVDCIEAKDLDDAISIDILPNGNYYLGVHIADVSHYVKKDGEIDKEAYLRGTSVYLDATTTPMLPEKLSNDLCSLNPHEDKLTLSFFTELDPNGVVVKYERPVESVIRSCARLTYVDVFGIINEDKELCEKFSYVKKDILRMKDLAIACEKQRQKRGEINFNIPEAQAILGTNDEVVDIVIRDNNAANKLIEDFMITANENCATQFEKLGTPFVFRIHDKPQKLKLSFVASALKTQGFKVPKVPSKVDQAYFNSLSRMGDDDFTRSAINRFALRAMPKAIYSEKNIGHFGLASESYCHATSPIRRYPDLVIHRIMKDYIHGKINMNKLDELKDFVRDAAERSSEREQSSEKAERMASARSAAELMTKHIGETFQGRVANVVPNGAYISIMNNTIEGYARFDSAPAHEINAARKLRMGQRVEVVCQKANEEEKTIDLSIVKVFRNIPKQSQEKYQPENQKKVDNRTEKQIISDYNFGNV